MSGKESSVKESAWETAVTDDKVELVRESVTLNHHALD